MPNIILEGIDASGKSTLADRLSKRYRMPIQRSEGPPHHPGEMNERVRRYASITDTIFDRHPVVSQSIYGTLRATHHDPIDPELTRQFYDSAPLFIYCEPASPDLSRHVIDPKLDTEEHLSAVRANYDKLLALYRLWATTHAHLIRRIGHSDRHIVAATDQFVERYSSPDLFSDIQDFHYKFGLIYDGPPRRLPSDLQEFRFTFLEEELEEYEVDSQLHQQLDALVDLTYVALGTAYLHGFDFNEAWRRVHAANMRKVRALSPKDSTRNSTHDVVKPKGWVPPDLTDLANDAEAPPPAA